MIKGNYLFQIIFYDTIKKKNLKESKNRKDKEIFLALTCEIQYRKLITINYMATDKHFIRVKLKQSCSRRNIKTLKANLTSQLILKKLLKNPLRSNII